MNAGDGVIWLAVLIALMVGVMIALAMYEGRQQQ
jgi:hypothetical protein